MLNLTNDNLLKTSAYINGRWVNNDIAIDVLNPATGEAIAQVAKIGKAETQKAIDAAFLAQKSWQQKTAKERASLLRDWYNAIMANIDDLAHILTAEQGKILAEAKAEIAYGASYVEWFAEEAKRIYGDIIAPPSADKKIIVTKQPIGVVACITPWNFPNAMLTRKIAPALAAGCSVVCKPASETPLSALALAVLAEQVGIPAGVINIIVGDAKEIGDELTTNTKIRKLTFTGSTEVGKLLQAKCATTMKRTSMELGGNAPFIVFDDADLDAAAAGLIASKFRNSGQTCICANRIFVQDNIYDVFAEKLAAKISLLNVGAGTQENIQLGPLISEKAAAKVHDLVTQASNEGAKILLGGKPHHAGSHFYEPTILESVTNDMQIAQTEIFGPVIPLIKFSSEDEAVHMANDTNVGLACYFYSKDNARIWRVSNALEYGIVGINEGVVSNEMAPFGGMKESGQGREGSKYGLDDYLEIKYCCMGGL